MAGHGLPWPAIAGHGLPWSAIAGHVMTGWPSMACHGQRCRVGLMMSISTVDGAELQQRIPEDALAISPLLHGLKVMASSIEKGCFILWIEGGVKGQHHPKAAFSLGPKVGLATSPLLHGLKVMASSIKKGMAFIKDSEGY